MFLYNRHVALLNSNLQRYNAKCRPTICKPVLKTRYRPERSYVVQLKVAVTPPVETFAITPARTVL